jgi:hypothetical protein
VDPREVQFGSVPSIDGQPPLAGDAVGAFPATSTRSPGDSGSRRLQFLSRTEDRAPLAGDRRCARTQQLV